MRFIRFAVYIYIYNFCFAVFVPLLFCALYLCWETFQFLCCLFILFQLDSQKANGVLRCVLYSISFASPVGSSFSRSDAIVFMKCNSKHCHRLRVHTVHFLAWYKIMTRKPINIVDFSPAVCPDRLRLLYMARV